MLCEIRRAAGKLRASLCFGGRGWLRQRKESEEAFDRRLVALDFRVSGPRRLREGAAFEDHRGERTGVGFYGRVRFLRGSAGDDETSVGDYGMESIVAEADRYSIEHLDKEERGEYMDMKKVGETKKREENE